jgi:hypothetical protein
MLTASSSLTTGTSCKPPSIAKPSNSQLEWLLKVLDLVLKNEEPVIILSHRHLLKETPDEKRGLLWNQEEVVAILLRYPNMRAVLSGHYHSAANTMRGEIEFVVAEAFAGNEVHTFYACNIAEVDASGIDIKQHLS